MATIVDFLAIFADLLPLPSTQIAQTSCRSAHLQVRLCTASAVQLSAKASLSRNADAALRDAVDVDGQLNYETHTAMSAQYREKCQHSTGTNLPAVGSLAISYDNIASKFLMAASAAFLRTVLFISTCTHKSQVKCRNVTQVKCRNVDMLENLHPAHFVVRRQC